MSEQERQNPIEHHGRVIRTEVTTRASPDEAYEAWADPQKIAHWFPDRAEGQAVRGATITWIFDKFNYRIPYEVLRAEPGKHFAIRWNPPPGMNPGILEVTISKESGNTVIRLVNSGFREGAQWEDEYQGVDSGWRMALAMLKLYLENYFGIPRSSFLAMKPAEYSAEELQEFHRTPTGLARWLTAGGGFGAVGDTFVLELRGGGRVSGRVLAMTARETELSWEEIHGVLELKAFSMGPQKMLAVRGCGWGWPAAEAREVQGRMEEALERLVQALSEKGATG